MGKLMQNKKIIALCLLELLLAIVVVAYMLVGPGGDTKNPVENNNDNPVVESPETTDDMYIRDENGNIKNVLVIDNEEYHMSMDLLGTWKEYLLPTDQRDKYQAFMIPDKTSDAIPYFYVLIEESPKINSETVIEEEIIYSLKNEYDSFELEQILKKTGSGFTKYSITYKTIKDRAENKNYLTIIYQDGYKISFTYSALSIAYAAEKGYIDDMINTFEFEKK